VVNTFARWFGVAVVVASEISPAVRVDPVNSGGVVMGRVVAIVSMKGGVGKTTLAANLAATAISDTSSVALVDADQQGTLSRWALGRERLDRVTPDASTRRLTNASNAELTPSTPDGERPVWCHPVAPIPGAVIVPVSPAIRLDAVSEIHLGDLADTVFVDTPPDVGCKLVHAVIRNATDVVVPVAPELWCLEAIPEVFGALRDAGRDDLVDRVVVTLNMKMKNSVHDALETILRKTYGRQVSDVVFPRAIAFTEAALKRSVVPPKTANGKLFAALWKSIATKSVRRAA
jgi:cellulose biosynthesis protein BcsQ